MQCLISYRLLDGDISVHVFLCACIFTYTVDKLLTLPGHKLSEEGQLSGTIWLEDPVQSRPRPPHNETTRLGLPLHQCRHQPQAKAGTAVYVARRYGGSQIG